MNDSARSNSYKSMTDTLSERLELFKQPQTMPVLQTVQQQCTWAGPWKALQHDFNKFSGMVTMITQNTFWCYNKKNKLIFQVLVKYLSLVVSPNEGEYLTDYIFHDFLNVAMSLVTCMSLKSIIE